MCWTLEASAAIAGVGIACTIHGYLRGEDKSLLVPLGYFSLMEVLQAYTYTIINQCDNPANQVATLLGYIHIAFQPFFINALSMYFVPQKVREKISGPVYFLCFASTVFMLLQVYPFSWAGKCSATTKLCGEYLCSVSGNWHIAWVIPFNDLGKIFVSLLGYLPINNLEMFAYTFSVFILPVLYGSWRVTSYNFLMGLVLADFLTNNHNESPAVWCLLSVGILLVITFRRIRNSMRVKKWFWWPKAWCEGCS